MAGPGQHIEIGAKADGTIVGLRGHLIADVGAYPQLAVFLPTLTRMMAAGVYTIPRSTCGRRWR